MCWLDIYGPDDRGLTARHCQELPWQLGHVLSDGRRVHDGRLFPEHAQERVPLLVRALLRLQVRDRGGDGRRRASDQLPGLSGVQPVCLAGPR